MKLTPVESSNIKGIGYKKDVLVVQFHRENRVYLYYGVPKTTHMNFVKSPSKGSFFAKHVAGKYVFSELTLVPDCV